MNDNEARLRELFKTNLPEAPRSPWFTRKVLNRLPERSVSRYRWIENAAYIVAAILLTIFWIVAIVSVDNAGKFTGNDLITFASLTAMSCATGAMFVVPRLRAWIRD